MNRSEIIALQTRIGTAPDGFWGPKSMAAGKDYLRKLMPYPNPWPTPTQASLSAFYGAPGDESRLTRINVAKLGVEYDDEPVTWIRCHQRVAESLLRIITAIHRGPCAYVLLDYAGVFNNRPMRGGSLPSLHARGAAIDLRPLTNGNHAHWPVTADMPIQVMEEFAREGWLPAGAFWSRDAMHFQATQ